MQKQKNVHEFLSSKEMKHVLKLFIIVVSVFLTGYVLEEAIDQSGLNTDLVEHPLEILSELFSAFAALSIFAMTWHAYTKSRDNNSLFLGCSFAVIGVFILFHMLSYPFMPDFITPNSYHKSAIFLLESRLILGISLIASAYTYKDTLPKLINKRILLSSIIVLSAASLAILPFYHYIFKYLPENGHSPLTILVISMNAAIILYAIYLYDKRIKETGQKNLIFLIYGCTILVFSDIIYFYYEFSGHFLIITGFFFIHLALYKNSVELPYEKLALAEEKLRHAAEEKYRNVFDNANDAIVTIDLDERVTSWNQAAEKIFGWTAKEAMGKKLSNLIVRQDKQDMKNRIINSVLNGGGVSGIDVVCPTRGGGEVDVSLTVSPLRDADGNITGMSGIMRDITERREREVWMNRFFEAIDNSSDGIIIADEKDRYIYLNEAYAKICGYPQEELLGETWRKLMSSELIAATDLEVARTIHNKDVGILSGEFLGMRKDGITIPLDLRATGLWDEKGNYQGHICTIRDITERKRAEEKLHLFRQLIDQSTDAFFVADSETGRIFDANDRAWVNLGYEREELLNMRVLDFEVDLPDQFSWKEHVKEVQNRGYMLLEGRHRRQNGTTFPVEVNVSSTVLGKNSYLVAVVRDITERKQAEEQLMQSLKEKEILLREIHHRVKNNLMIVSSLLAHQSQYIRDKNVIDMFTESQNRILSISLVHEKLYRSKDLAKIDFNEYINDMVADLVQSYEVNGSKITLNTNIENIPLDIDLAIPCGLIINELVTNSLKYAFPAGTQGEIRIAFRSIDEKLELVVGDNGIGILEDLDFRKTGSLGLHLVTTLAENQLHGEISLNRSRGTEFKIKFGGIK